MDERRGNINAAGCGKKWIQEGVGVEPGSEGDGVGVVEEQRR